MITLICPTYNEENYISSVLDFFVRSKPSEKELLVVDGGSEDKTKDIVREWCKKYKNIRLIENPHKTVPFALNIGINNSKGNPIIRLDAHTEYELNYIEKVIETFEEAGTDIVGGPMRAIGRTNFQKAVAITTSTKFGVGDSKIHDEEYEGPTDHVYLGAWKRELFDQIGYFDEQLKRNQDDEFHYRAKSLGKLIYINPEIRSYYFPRKSYLSLIKQYFQYGFFKPIVMLKIKSEVKVRHLIPSIFTIYIMCLPVSLFYYYYSLPLLAYIITDVYYILRIIGSFRIKLHAFLLYPILHLSYGMGVITGFINRIFSGLTEVFKK